MSTNKLMPHYYTVFSLSFLMQCIFIYKLTYNFINSTTADYIFNAMQDLSPEYEAKAKSITDPFTGDPGWNIP